MLIFSGCNESDIQLVDGSNAFEGRVEVCVDEQWSTVCSLSLPGWGRREAEVVCRQSGKLTDSKLGVSGLSIAYIVQYELICHKEMLYIPDVNVLAILVYYIQVDAPL